MTRAGVLVVDADTALRELASGSLRAASFPTWTAASGREARELLGRHRSIGVVAVARVVGRESGLVLLRSLTSTRKRLVGVFLTDRREGAALRCALEDGAVHRAVLRPWDAEELREALREAVAHHEVLRENRRLALLLRRRQRQLGRLHERLDHEVERRCRWLAEVGADLHAAARRAPEEEGRRSSVEVGA